jgi:alkanesulfonate monooxygenase SsuD/methylene tetrahydromethanopterin reductase-like flavin-dependent oxidoreductase (luciferase family)
LPGDNADLVGSDALRDYLGRRYGLAGPPEECLERLREIEATGAIDGVLLVPYGEHLPEIERIGESIVGRV